MEAPSPPRSFQGGESPLVSVISTGRQQSLPLHSRRQRQVVVHNLSRSRLNSTSVNRQDVSTFPTLLQQEAIGFLRDFDDRTIFDWLTLLRSLQPGYQHCTQPGGLPGEQFNAISSFRDCPNDLILAWLNLARCVGRRASSRTSPRNSGHSTQTIGNSNKWTTSLSSTSRTSATSLGPPSPYNDRTSHGSPTSSPNRGPGFSFLNLSREPSISETASPSTSDSYTYWCTVCEHRRAFQTRDGWKRHMKEHETSYICMPYGPVEPTEIGPKCVFCGTPDPNEDHLATHNHTLCVGKLVTARSYSRRSHLLKHLENHGTHSPGTLADKWRCTLLNKRFFSCGFCISLFTAHSGLLKHLDLVHFRHSQDVSEWDCNKVIKGLLLSPEVEKHWRSIMSFCPLADSARITWDLSVVKDLQMRLEICEEAAEVLAQAAFDKSVCEWPHGFISDSRAASSSTDQQMDTDLNLLEYQHQAATSQLPSADSAHLVTGSTGLPISNKAYGQASDIPWTALDGGNRQNSSLAVSGVPQDQAQFSEQGNAMDLGQDNHGAQIPSNLRNT